MDKPGRADRRAARNGAHLSGAARSGEALGASALRQRRVSPAEDVRVIGDLVSRSDEWLEQRFGRLGPECAGWPWGRMTAR